ncbi:MAG: hydrogenase 4 subunit F [Thermincola sp.]|jgi:hydrogenase-4 component F|nr:hydrogenase 4 subunit F [Thermincola sp.]
MALLLLALPLAAALLCLVPGKRKILSGINILASLTILAAALVLSRTVFATGPVLELGEFIYVDSLGAFIISIIAVVGLVSACYSVVYASHDLKVGEIRENRLKWYYFWFYIFVFTMLAVVMVNNLGMMWVAIEGTTLASALLVGFYDKRGSLEAAWKYIIICTVGIVFALFGTILLYYAAVSAATGGSSPLNWTSLVKSAEQLDPRLLKLAFIFVLVGYGTKVGLAPMHTWLPDAHSQAPAPVSAMLSGVLLNCALYGILRFHLITSKALGTDFSANLLLVFGLISIAVSLPFILVQHDFKRMLAYSSIEHMGIIATAIGIGGKLGLYGAFLHMLNHAITKSTMFFVAGNVTQKYHTKKIAKITGAVKSMPVSGPVLLVCTFALAGVPPFNIFLSEFAIISSGFMQGKYFVTGIMLGLITVVFAGLIFVVSKMAFGDPSTKIKPGENGGWSALIITLPLIVIFLMGIYVPSFVDKMLIQVVSLMGVS